MGREVKRVALDFQWPLDKVWSGYLNPHYDQCSNCVACAGSGYSPEASALRDQWYGNAPFSPESRDSKPFLSTDDHIVACASRNIERAPEYYGKGPLLLAREARRLATLFNRCWAHHLNNDDVAALIAHDRLMDFTHAWTAESGWQRKEPAVIPGAHDVNVWSCMGFGHDSINCYTCVEAECKRLGYPLSCASCKGKGSVWTSAEAEATAKNWECIEPPAGEGWQIWETVSEGSPITPVFATRETLIDYLVEGGDGCDRKRGDGGWTRENAESFVTAAWAPSLIGMAGKLHAPRDGMPTMKAST